MEPEVKLAEVDVPYAVALRMKRAVLAELADPWRAWAWYRVWRDRVEPLLVGVASAIYVAWAVFATAGG